MVWLPILVIVIVILITSEEGMMNDAMLPTFFSSLPLTCNAAIVAAVG
jgi:hypothetical protein